jgi:predicted HTH domain antitoxin
MQVIFEVPEDIARALLTEERSIDRAAVEAIAAEGYRSGLLSESQLNRLLGLPSKFAVHDWLRERRIPYQYTEADLASDLATLAELGLR